MKILPVFAGIIYWSVNKREGAAILLGYFSADSVNQLIKNTACIYRPWILDKRLYVDAAAKNGATGYSLVRTRFLMLPWRFCIPDLRFF